MVLNIALQREQEQREENGRAAYEAQINRETDLNTDLYSGGFFDGLIGCEPRHLEEQSYWEGYQIGLRENWATRLGVEIPSEF